MAITDFTILKENAKNIVSKVGKAAKSKYGPFVNLLLNTGKVAQEELKNKSREWFQSKARLIRGKINAKDDIFLGDNAKLTTELQIGRMYMFYYDPKHKKTLPYYDMMPLIFPFEQMEDGFLGINFHYLPRNARAILMDELFKINNNPKLDSKTRLNLNYQLLKRMSRFDLVKPTIHHYLTDHVRSKFINIPPVEWDIALMLPTERFVGAKVGKVYMDSVGSKR